MFSTQPFLVSEMSRAKDRGRITMLIELSYCVMGMLTGLIYYLDPFWKHFEVYLAILPGIVCICLL